MKNLSLVFVIVSFLSVITFAQVNVTLPSFERELGAPDEYISINADYINIADSVGTFGFSLHYDKNVIRLYDFKPGTLTENSIGAFYADTANGVINAEYVRITPYSGSGSLAEIKIKFIGPGTSKLTFVNSSGSNTFHFMNGVPPVVTNEGAVSVTQPVSVKEFSNKPLEFKLEQNYPNPFNPSTTIAFSIDQTGLTTLKIYSITGEEAAVLINTELKAGRYVAAWDASGMASGVYYAKLHSGRNVAVKKIMLLK